MNRTVRRPAADREAKAVHSQSAPVDSFRLTPSVAAEVGGALARCLQVWKAEHIGERLGISRSHVYALAGEPADAPLSLLAQLADMDPDPDLLARVAHALLIEQAGLAARRKASGKQSITLATPGQGRLW